MRLIGVTCLSLAATPVAGDISLALPVDCTLGDTCYIQQVVDQDPGPGIRDFQCGLLSYDGHKGTDFALPSLEALEAGVAVLAAAPGQIRAVRNNMADVLQGVDGAPSIDGVECGNGVVIRHADGWETQYCHLAQGSVAVDVGDQVAAGDTLGFIGLSGDTEFPHLHLSLRRNGEVVDPFDPDMTQLCDAPSPGLWADDLALAPGGLISIGFADGIPDYADIKAGTADAAVLTSTGPAMVLWGFGYGTQARDVMQLVITGPDGGVVFETAQDLERTQAQMFRAGGRRTPADGWKVGDYIGTVTLIRDGIVLGQHSTTVPMRAP